MEMSLESLLEKCRSAEFFSDKNNLNGKRLNSELNSFASTHSKFLSKWKFPKVFFTDKTTYIHYTYIYIYISNSFCVINLILEKLKMHTFLRAKHFIVLFPEISQVKYFFSFTRPNWQMYIRMCIFHFKKKNEFVLRTFNLLDRVLIFSWFFIFSDEFNVVYVQQEKSQYF